MLLTMFLAGLVWTMMPTGEAICRKLIRAIYPTFLGSFSRFRLSNFSDEDRFAGNRTVKCAGYVNDNKVGRKT